MVIGEVLLILTILFSLEFSSTNSANFPLDSISLWRCLEGSQLNGVLLDKRQLGSVQVLFA